MWLINTSTLRLEEFQTCPSWKYAILSHRWEDDEVNFDEFKSGQGRQKRGFWKIEKCCQQAKARGLEYAWVDTCCIDKRSSAELSEAINSMYNWYANAYECYVYMSDVYAQYNDDDANSPRSLSKFSTSEQRESTKMDTIVGNLSERVPKWTEVIEGYETRTFNDSKWFTRGWTLQELLAPSLVWFFDRRWLLLGDKKNLQEVISSTTSISFGILMGMTSLEACSVAQRMSWAARRETTRIEDVAYCLLGIFDVNMPLLYGEGRKAFIRLQEAIIQQSDDETIFAWSGVPENGSGLLAGYPEAFALGRHIVRQTSRDAKPAFAMTNRGLSISCRLVPFELNTYFVPLECELKCIYTRQHDFVLGIYLCRTGSDDQYRRVPSRGYDLGISAKLPKGKGVVDLESPAVEALLRKRHCRAHCPQPCSSYQVQEYEDRMLYVPQSLTMALPTTGPIRFRIKDSLISGRLNSGKAPFSSAEQDENVKLDFIPFAKCGRGDTPWRYVATNAHVEAFPMETQDKMLSIEPHKLNEGIYMVFHGFRLSVRYIRIGFDVFWNPICVIAFQDNDKDLSHEDDFVSWLHNRNKDRPFLNFASSLDRKHSVQFVDGMLVLIGDRISGLEADVPIAQDQRIDEELFLHVSLKQSRVNSLWSAWHFMLREQWLKPGRNSSLEQNEDEDPADDDSVVAVADVGERKGLPPIFDV